MVNQLRILSLYWVCGGGHGCKKKTGDPRMHVSTRQNEVIDSGPAIRVGKRKCQRGVVEVLECRRFPGGDKGAVLTKRAFFPSKFTTITLFWPFCNHSGASANICKGTKPLGPVEAS